MGSKFLLTIMIQLGSCIPDIIFCLCPQYQFGGGLLIWPPSVLAVHCLQNNTEDLAFTIFDFSVSRFSFSVSTFLHSMISPVINFLIHCFSGWSLEERKIVSCKMTRNAAEIPFFPSFYSLYVFFFLRLFGKEALISRSSFLLWFIHFVSSIFFHF